MKLSIPGESRPAAMVVSVFYHSPADVLIDLGVQCGLRRRVPVWHWLYALTDLRISTISQRLAVVKFFRTLR